MSMSINRFRNASALAGAALIGVVHATAVTAQEEDVLALEEVVVTGSFIRRPSQADSPSPLQVVGSEDIFAIGASTIRDLTNTLTANAGAQNNADAFTQNRTPGTENINLRGLGVQSTLVLLNSKRQVGVATATDDGLQFVDTASLVPLIAIERVEVLKDGAASLYGTDAVAGVVNFITRDDFEGAQLEFDYQTTANGGDQAADYRVSGIFGAGNDRGHVTASFSYLDRGDQSFRSRDFRPAEFTDPAGDDILSISSLTAFPANFLVPFLVDPATNANLAAQGFDITSNFDQNTAVFAFPGAVPGPLGAAGVAFDADPTNPGNAFLSPFPVLPDFAGGFNVGSFSTFLPNAAVGGADPFALSDGLTVAGLGGVLPAALGTLGVTDFSVGSSLTPVQQAAFADQLTAISQFVGAQQQVNQFNSTFTPFAAPAFPDPTGCEIPGETTDAVLLAPNPGSADATVISPLGQCGFDFLPSNVIIPEETRLQGFAQARYDITDTIEFYGEFGYARNRALRQTSDLPITAPPVLGPTNPFTLATLGVPVPLVYTGRTFTANELTDPFAIEPNPITSENDTLRVQAGLRGDIVDDWTFDFSIMRAFNENEFEVSDTLLGNLNLALVGLGGQNCNPLTDTPGTGGCLFFNPYASGVTADPSAMIGATDPIDGSPILDADGNQVMIPVQNSVEVLDFITGSLDIFARSTLTVADAVVAGTAFDLPAGPLGVAVGFQFRNEGLEQEFADDANNARFNVTPQPLSDFSANRDTYAVFGEVALPVFNNDTLGKFDISAAVRFEDTEGVGETVDPKVAVLYAPKDWIALRGSYSTSFRSPSLFQSFGNNVIFNAVVDPLTGQAPFLPILIEGSEDIDPETSRQFSGGILLEPDWLLPGLRLDFGYYDFEFEDVVIPVEPQVLVDAALPDSSAVGFSGVVVDAFTTNVVDDATGNVVGSVTRTPTGALGALTTSFSNAAFINTNGIDFSASYDFDAGAFGQFRTTFDGTYVISYEIPGLDADGNVIANDVVDLRNSLTGFANPIPDLRWNWGLNWFLGGHSANVFVRYIDSYEDDANCAASDPIAAGSALAALDPSLAGQTFAGSTSFLLGAGIGCADFEDIDSFVTLDAQYAYNFGDIGPLKGMTITAGVINAFNEAPPFVETDGAFDTRTHDPRGRLVYARLRIGF